MLLEQDQEMDRKNGKQKQRVKDSIQQMISQILKMENPRRRDKRLNEKREKVIVCNNDLIHIIYYNNRNLNFHHFFKLTSTLQFINKSLN